jgi:intraflagellar transport protein 172
VKEAISLYMQGHAYQQAVDLCRKKLPGEVVGLEEKWGDYLVSQNQLDAAINHYIEVCGGSG